MITLSNVLVLAALLFCISVAGIFLNRKNILIILMCIELMLLSVNMNFIAFSYYPWPQPSLRSDWRSLLSCSVTGIRLMLMT